MLEHCFATWVHTPRRCLVTEGAARSGAKLFGCRPSTPIGEPGPGCDLADVELLEGSGDD